MKTFVQVVERCGSIQKQIDALEVKIKKEDGFPIAYELRKELTHLIQLKNAYLWVLE